MKQPQLPPDKLEQLQVAVRELRDKEREIADLEDRIKRLRTEVSDIRHRSLPELFYEAHVDHVGLPAEGNRPAVDAVMRKEYKAAIPANWPVAKREQAFKTLDELELGDLQKITFTIPFEAGQRSRADEFSKFLTLANYHFSVARSVHHMSLSSALKEICEQGHVPSLPQLEAIGGFIGTSVDLKPRKD
jgi:hypothetical protein